MFQKNLCCLVKSGRLVFVANFFHNLDYVAYKLLLINHNACTTLVLGVTIIDTILSSMQEVKKKSSI